MQIQAYIINGKLEYNSKDGFIKGFPSVFFTAKYFLLLYCFFHRFYSGAHFVEENVWRFVQQSAYDCETFPFNGETLETQHNFRHPRDSSCLS